MLEHNELTQDEEKYPDLTEQIQQNYPINQDDQQSLQRIRQRILQASNISSQPSQPQANILPGQFLPPPVRRRSHAWRWRSAILAALILVALSVSTYVSIVPNALSFVGRTLPWDSATPQGRSNTSTILLHNQPFLTQIDMKSATIGWGEGELSDGITQKRVIVRTVDGGRSWNEIDLPAPYTSYQWLFALDETTAWVIPNDATTGPTATSLIRTLDGGKTWEKFTIPGGIGAVTFVDKENGWAMGVLQAGQNAFSQNFAVLHTTDGGKTWTQVNDGQELSAGSSTLNGVWPALFINPQMGWVIPARLASSTQPAVTPGLYVTYDGGRDWQLQDLPQSNAILPSSDSTSNTFGSIGLPSFFDAQHGDIILSVTSQGSIKINVYSTVDGGQTWQLTGNSVSEPRLGGVPATFTFVDPTHFLVNDNNLLEMYALIGGQWKEKYHTSLKGLTTYNVSFVNGQTGWILAQKGVVTDKKSGDKTYTSFIYKTNNGGQSWQVIEQGSYVIYANAPHG